MKIWFDMDGTLANLYGVSNWLPMLRASDPTPYQIAKPLVNLSLLARYLNKLQRLGHTIGIISWLSRDSTPEYDELVNAAKIAWLNIHLPSVKWDEIHIVSYGTDKWSIAHEGIIFDDDERIHNTWEDEAYLPDDIFNILKEIVAVN